MIDPRLPTGTPSASCHSTIPRLRFSDCSLPISLRRRDLHGRGMWGAYPDAVLPGLAVVEGGQTSTGSIVAWFRRLVSGA